MLKHGILVALKLLRTSFLSLPYIMPHFKKSSEGGNESFVSVRNDASQLNLKFSYLRVKCLRGEELGFVMSEKKNGPFQEVQL